MYVQTLFNESPHHVVVFANSKVFIKEADFVEDTSSYTRSERYYRKAATKQVSDEQFLVIVLRPFYYSNWFAILVNKVVVTINKIGLGMFLEFLEMSGNEVRHNLIIGIEFSDEFTS